MAHKVMYCGKSGLILKRAKLQEKVLRTFSNTT